MKNEFEFPFNVHAAKKEVKEAVAQEWNDLMPESWESFRKKHEKFELPLSRQEYEIFLKVQEYVDIVAKEFGGNPAPIYVENIFGAKPGAVFEMTNGHSKRACCFPRNMIIVIEKSNSPLEFAFALVHEIVHLKGYNELRPAKEEEELDLYRTGISLHSLDGEKVYFHEIEEALVSNLVKLIYETYLRKDSDFVEEIEDSDRAKASIEKLFSNTSGPKEAQKRLLKEVLFFPKSEKLIQTLESDKSEEYKMGYLSVILENMIKENNIVFHERENEREKFEMLVKKIQEHSAYSQQEIEQAFYQAHFSGKYLNLARMIEGALGKGAFRDIANSSAEIRTNSK